MLNKNAMNQPYSSAHMAGNPNLDLLKWIVDSRATDHMISNWQHLHNETIVRNAGKVQLPTGDLASVSHVSSIQLNEGEVIKNVLCVPAF